tara:strand:+ start:2434 stop:3462 length:1029 start_codon:yes stop_codon:yes gene_type:complete
MIIAEVVETKYAYSPNQKDPDTGENLALGSIQVRIGGNSSNLGQTRNIFCRPAVFNLRTPLIGEIVYLISAPTNDWSSDKVKNSGFLYFSPLNTTSDIVLHSFPRIWKRKASINSTGAERKSDKEEPGYTFPKNPSPLDRLQPFEGDDLFEGRFGHSIRFGSTIQGGDDSVYAKKPTWKGNKNGDPITIIRVAKPSGDGKKYSIEDIGKDESSIYLTSAQSLSKLKGGFDKNTDVKQLGQKSIAQIVVNSKRVVINAYDDTLFLIGKDKAILTGKKVLLQSDKYKVDLDELMDFLKKWLGEDSKLAQGSAQYSTAAGPTATSTNVAAYIQLQASDFTKFKLP